MSRKPPKKKIRIYEDHTGRWYTDYTQIQFDKLSKDWQDHPVFDKLAEEIRKEINKEILESIYGIKNNA